MSNGLTNPGGTSYTNLTAENWENYFKDYSSGPEGTPSFEGLLTGLNVSLPPGYEDYTYEYDPAREDFLREKLGLGMSGYTSARDYGIGERKGAMEYGIGKRGREVEYGIGERTASTEHAIGGAYSNLLSGLRGISEQGKASLMKARGGGGGGFSGGGNLLGMSVQDLYSGTAAQRGSAVGDYTSLRDYETGALSDYETEQRGALADYADYQRGAFTDYEDYQRDAFADYEAEQRGAFGDYETYQTDETQRLINMLQAPSVEDVRGDREEWERGAMSHLLDLQNLYGKPLSSGYQGDRLGG